MGSGLVGLYMKEFEGELFTISRNSLTWEGPSLHCQQGPSMSKHQTQKIKRCGDTVSIDVYFIVRKPKQRFALHLCLLGLALALILRTFPKYSFFFVGVLGATCQSSPFSLWEGTRGRAVLLASCKQEGGRDSRRVLTMCVK